MSVGLTIIIAIQPFWGKVPPSTNSLRLDGIQAGSQTKISNLDKVLGVDQEVTGFNITMDLLL